MWRAVLQCVYEYDCWEELGCVKKAVTAVGMLVLPDGSEQGP